MVQILRPKTAEELVEIIQIGKPISLMGLGTKSTLGRPITAQQVSLAQLSGIIAYEPEELILEIAAATPLSKIEALLTAQNQHLAFEPPDLSQLLGSASSGSIGGVIACNLSGSRRLTAGAARDHIMGMTAVSGRGEIFKAGARVVKNVTGYDLPKLMAHSYGTLAAMTAIIMKVLPAPESEETLCISDLTPDTSVKIMSLAMQSSCEVSGAAFADGKTLLRLEGIPASIAYRRDKLAMLLNDYPHDVLPAEQSRAIWQRVRNVWPLADNLERDVWKISTAPSEAPDFIAAVLAKTKARYLLDWAGGLIWLDLPASFDCGSTLVRGSLKSGHSMLVRGAEDKKKMVPIFQPQEQSLAALTRRVKASFDPNGILNPGRMFEGC